MRPASHPTGDHEMGGAPGPAWLGHACMIRGFGWLVLREEPPPTDTCDHHPPVARFRVCMVVAGAVGARNSRSPTGPTSWSISSVSVAVTGRGERPAGITGLIRPAAWSSRRHGPHLAGHTHGVDMTMKSRLRAVPDPDRKPVAHEPGLPRIPPDLLDLIVGDGAGWAEQPNPVVTLTAVPDPLARPFPTRPSLPGATRPAVVPLPPAQGEHRILALRSTPGPGSGVSVFARPGASPADM